MGQNYYQIAQLNTFPMLKHGISTVEDGNLSFKWGEKDDVLKNRSGFLNKLNLQLQDCVALSTRDSDIFEVVVKKDLSKGMTDITDAIPGDALITCEKNVVLFLLTADCLPIIYFDPKRECIALAHLSWKATEQKLASKVVEKMKELGSIPNDITVAIGPGIRKESFTFVNPIQKKLPGWEPYLHDLQNGETSIDLVGYNTQQLVDAGIASKNIVDCGINTAIDTQFFSHYRSVRTGEPEGRFATVVGML